MEIEGRFVRKRVPPIAASGVFKGNGSLSTRAGALRVRGKRVPSKAVRWVLGIIWYVGLIFVAAYALKLAFPESGSGQTGLSIPIILLAYVAANHFHWVNEDFEVPLSSIRAIASDPARGLLAVSISGHPNSSPIVMRVSTPPEIDEVLIELQSNARPSQGAQPGSQQDAAR
jgi:hypothetical protein